MKSLSALAIRKRIWSRSITLGQSTWCVHYHPEVDSKIMGQGDTMEEAWASARENCAGDPVIN